jgi:hypothetical protein
MFVTLPLAIFAELTHTSQRHGCHIASSIVMMFMGVLQHCGVVTSFVLLPPSDFRPMFIELLFDFRPTSIELPSTNYHPQTSIHRRPSIVVHIWYYIFQTISNALYCYKILGHGTTWCPRMMRALPLSRSRNISYKITHNHLSWFFWVHDLHNDTIKRLQCHCHLIQLLLRIQVQVTSTVLQSPFGGVK